MRESVLGVVGSCLGGEAGRLGGQWTALTWWDSDNLHTPPGALQRAATTTLRSVWGRAGRDATARITETSIPQVLT